MTLLEFLFIELPGVIADHLNSSTGHNAQDGLVRGAFQWIGFQSLDKLRKRRSRRQDNK